MAISDDWTIDYTNLRIYHSSGTTVYSVNQLYSYLMDVFDESGTIDDTIPMTAQTPTAYTLTNGWYLDYAPSNNNNNSHEYLNGGSIKTIGWDSTSYSNGIRVITFAGSYTPAVGTDLGLAVTQATSGDSGTLLAYDNTLQKWWIRVDATSDTFSSTTDAISVSGGSGSGVISTGTNYTGENVWANPFTLGTIESQTNLYLIQNGSALTSWWSTGHIDILALIKEAGTEIDTGLITFFARQYTKLYDYYTADLSDGARTPIPLATTPDTNNTTGYRQMVLVTTNDAFVEGDLIQDDSDPTIQGIVTSYDTGTNTLQYYLAGALNDFSAATGTFSSVSPGTGTGTAVDPTDVGPNASPNSTITATFGHNLYDLSNGNGNRPYSVVIDCQSVVPIAQVYERLKYITRRGETSNIDAGSQTIYGQNYTGIGDYLVAYDSQSTAFVEGETINGQTSGATGVITSDYDQGTTGYLVLRDVRGTFQDGENLRNSTTVRAVANIPSGAEVITPAKQSPFGTFAGSKFFGARGVLVINVPTADSTNYELIDTLGVRQIPPNIVGIEVTGVAENSQCYIVDSTPTVYLNAAATTAVSGNIYKASTTLTYSTDIAVTIRAREMGYLPFETTGTIGSSGLSITAVWLVDSNWKYVVSGVNITFTNSNSRITRASGDFTADGWVEQMSQVTVSGSTSNDGTYTLDDTVAVTATYITITGASLTDEGPVSGVTLTYTRRSLT